MIYTDVSFGNQQQQVAVYRTQIYNKGRSKRMNSQSKRTNRFPDGKDVAAFPHVTINYQLSKSIDCR